MTDVGSIATLWREIASLAIYRTESMVMLTLVSPCLNSLTVGPILVFRDD